MKGTELNGGRAVHDLIVQEIAEFWCVELTPEEVCKLTPVYRGVGKDRFEGAFRAYARAYATNGKLRFLNLNLFVALTVEFQTTTPLQACTYSTAEEVRRKLLALHQPKPEPKRWFPWSR